MPPSLIVLKFGSSVLPNRAGLSPAVHEIYRHYRRGHQVLAIVSAIGTQTDDLLNEARVWATPPSPDRAVAELLATGEQQSAALLVMALHRAGVDSSLVDPFAIELKLRGDRLNASPISVDVRQIRQAFLSSPVLVLPGFSGVHEDGGRALMGRGGSDLTAVFLARELAAAHCRLVKDVDGIYEYDPAIKAGCTTGKPPHRYSGVTYDEAIRVSGALVQPKALEYLRDTQTTARVGGLLLEDGTDIGTPSTSARELVLGSPLKVLLLGLGSVGLGVYSHLRQLESFFEIVGIHVRDVSKCRSFDVRRVLLATDIEDLLSRPYDLIVDTSADSKMARTAIERSLRIGISAVTASRRLVATWGRELTAQAEVRGARLLYSAAVGGSAPMIERLKSVANCGAVTKLRGVLNGTSSYVLDRLAQGAQLHTAAAEARALGLAESDVSRDLRGEDSADKLRILARIAFGADADMIPIGLPSVTAIGTGQLGESTSIGKTVRLVATFASGGSASVQLESLPADDFLAGARGAENRLIISGAGGREWRVSGTGAGRWPTAEAILADMLDLHTQVVDGTARQERVSVQLSESELRLASA